MPSRGMPGSAVMNGAEIHFLRWNVLPDFPSVESSANYELLSDRTAAVYEFLFKPENGTPHSNDKAGVGGPSDKPFSNQRKGCGRNSHPDDCHACMVREVAIFLQSCGDRLSMRRPDPRPEFLPIETPDDPESCVPAAALRRYRPECR